jgi:hypothetical protein
MSTTTSKPLKPKRGTTAQNNNYTGEAYEVTLDTDKKTLVVHDGLTAGGFPLARADEVAAKDAAQDVAIQQAKSSAEAAGQAAAEAQSSANAAQSSANAANQGLVGVVRSVNGVSADAAGNVKILTVPNYNNYVEFNANTKIQAPYDCIVLWVVNSAIGDPAYFYISEIGNFTGEELVLPYYANPDGYSCLAFIIPKGVYFKTSRNFYAGTFSSSRYSPLKGG